MLNRRPLKTREIKLAKKLAMLLSEKNITPNQISVASIFFALLASVCLLSIHYYPKLSGSNLTWILPLLAALFIQLRLLCNMLDGMVAIEGGKSSPTGELYNEFPDRISDILILIAAGYVSEPMEYGIILGWCAALLAVLTAYVRVLAVSIGAPMNFAGPMAKPHRMFVMTCACLVATALSLQSSVWTKNNGYVFFVALIIIALGSSITIFRRLKSTYRYLEGKKI